jgi:integrase
MNYRIAKMKTLIGTERYEVRGWDGAGDSRAFWKRRFQTRAEAQHFVDEKLFQERTAKQEALKNENQSATLTVRDAYESWKHGRYDDLAPGWKCNVDQYWRFFEPKLAALNVTAISPDLVRGIERELRDGGNSKSTVKRKIGWLQSVFNYAVEMERIPYNPIVRFRTAKPAKPDLDFWEKAEAMSFLNYALKCYPLESTDHWKYLAYLVALNTAMRAGEIWALRPMDLRESFGVIHVTRQLDLIERRFRPLKGKEGRNVPLSKELSVALSAWIKRRGIGQGELIFSTEGLAIDHNNFAKRAFRQDLVAWKGKAIKFHGLRHTAATLMLAAGIDIGTVQKILGHKNVETTMRYVHALGDSVKNAAKTFSLSPQPIEEISQPIQKEKAARSLHLVKRG